MRNHLSLTAAALSAMLLTAVPDLPAQVGVEALRRGAAPASAPAATDPLAAVNADALEPFRSRVAAPGGRLRIVQGGRLVQPGLDPDEAAASFLSRLSDFFRYDDSLETVIERKGDGRRAHFRFLVDGIEIDRVSAIVIQGGEDGADVIGAAANLPARSTVLGDFLLTGDAARERSREWIRQVRLERGQADRGWLMSRAERRYFATDDGLIPAFVVEERADRFDGAYAVTIDARNGDLLRVIELVDRGTGSYPYIGQPNGVIEFPTTEGRVRVYKNQDQSRSGMTTRLDLKNLSNGVPAPSLSSQGNVVSARADTWDANANDAFNPQLDFNYLPFGSGLDYDHFDQVNVLYHIEKFYKHLTNAVGQTPATSFSLPVITNYRTSDINAYFSFSLFPIDGHTYGYLLFQDQTWDNPANPDPARDIARDLSVVAHEYTHAWLAFEGQFFLGSVDEPSRAVNEALADFYSLCYHKDTAWGRYYEDLYPGLGFLRDLQQDDHFPETTLFAMTLTASGLPEEHINGKIFGSMLIDLRNKTGIQQAERLVFDSLPYMPHQMSDVGYGTITVDNAVEATEEFFAACVSGTFGQFQNNRQIGAMLGAAAARGVMGTPTSSHVGVVDLETVSKRKFKFYSKVVRTGAEQSFGFKAQQGRTLVVKLVGKSGSGLTPDFTVTAYSGAPGAVVFTEGKHYKKAGRIVKQAGIRLNDTGLATYIISVEGLSGTTGAYTLTLDA